MVSSKQHRSHSISGIDTLSVKGPDVNILGFAGCMMVCVTPVSSALVAQNWSDTICKETALLCYSNSLFAKTGILPFDLQAGVGLALL